MHPERLPSPPCHVRPRDRAWSRALRLAVLPGALALVACSGSGGGNAAGAAAAASAPASGAGQAALTVTLVQPQRETWHVDQPANGNISAWQEAAIGAETGGLRIAEVRVNVGDRVRRGQTLAVLAGASVAADVAATRAALAEAEAAASEARANAERARALDQSGAISAQQIAQYLTAERTAQARLEAQRARLQADELRLSQTRVSAPDDGLISARTATVGAVAQPGQELFRLIRGGRLEWRAELTAAELARVQPGQRATVVTPDGTEVAGTVRAVAPTVDTASRNALVYVDLAPGSPARAGMFARGRLQMGEAAALTLPQAAVVLRDGYSYVFRLESPAAGRSDDLPRVAQTKVLPGRRQGDRVEIVEGLDAQARVVAAGVGFLNDGDRVRVVAAAAAASAPAAPASRP